MSQQTTQPKRKLPLRSPDEVKWNYQASFLYYFHELNPKASEDLLALNELYLKVFDENMPPPPEGWEIRHDKWVGQSGSDFDEIYSRFFDPPTRGINYWGIYRFRSFNKIFDIAWQMDEAYHKNLCEKTQAKANEILASPAGANFSQLTSHEISSYAWELFHERRPQEPDLQDTERIQEEFRMNLEALREMFFDWLDRYHFTGTDWLCRLAFHTLCQGTGRLKPWRLRLISAHLPGKTAAQEVGNTQGTLLENMSASRRRRNWDTTYYPPEPFTFSEQFNCEPFTCTEQFDWWDPPQEYEQRAVTAFREPIQAYEQRAVTAFLEHIRGYTARLEKEFSAAGYKNQRPPFQYSSVAWLILWNKYASPLQHICDEIGKLMCEPNAEKRLGKLEKPTSEGVLRKAWVKFKKYGLPVR